MGKIIVTFILTSLFWIALFCGPLGSSGLGSGGGRTDASTETVDTAAAETAPSARMRQSEKQPPQNTVADYSEAIVGKWLPVEGTENKLEFTRYGTLVLREKTTVGYLDSKKTYKLKGDKLYVDIFKKGRIVITSGANGRYLEIYGDSRYAGKYKLSK